jgi:PAS domain S-box-containing protein
MPNPSGKTLSGAREPKPAHASPGKSAEMFESVFRDSRVGMLVLSLEGRLLAVTPAICTFLGYSEQELLGTNIEAVTYPDDLVRTRETVRQVMAEQKNLLPLEMRFRHKDGQPRWGEFTASLVHGADGQPKYVLAQLANIADRKPKESAFRNIETSFSDLVNSLNAIVWRADVRTFRTTFVSRQAEKMLGYPIHCWLDTPTFWVDHIYPEDTERVLAFSAQAVAEKRNHNFEYRMIASDGSIIWLRNIVTVIVVNNEPAELLGVSVDVTDFKRMEESLRDSEERLRMATQTGKMFAYEWDAATDQVVRSEGVNHILGEDEGKHTTGQHLLTMIPPEDREKLFAAVAQLCPEKPFLRIRYRMVRADGTLIWVDRNSRAYFDEQGKMLRIVGMLADITDRVRAEEALAGMSRKLIEAQEQERVRIARELHDDIGQRLALLSLGIQQLKANIPDSADELRRKLVGLEKQTVEMAMDVQTLSHELHTAQLEYVGLVAAMRSFCTAFATKQKVKINFKHDRILPTVSQEVSLCLFRVMQEALNNAAKHSGVRSFEVKLRGSAEEISLTVRDSGVGFDPELPRTSGLGLVSMQERVNLVKGALSITSSPHSGTEVSVRVPLSGRASGSKAEVAGA